MIQLCQNYSLILQHGSFKREQMMKLHERLVNAMDNLGFPIKRLGTIEQIETIAPNLKRLHIHGNFNKLRIRPGDSMRLCIAAANYRHYTIAGFNKEKETCEVLVYHHSSGKAGAWLQNSIPGDTLILKIKKARRHLNLRFNPVFKQHFLFGDESSLGILQYIKSQADLYNHACLCLVELDQQHRYWPDLLLLGETMVVEKSNEDPAKEAIEQINLPGKIFKKRWAEAAFYLSGRSGSILALQKALYALGIPKRNIQIQPYWVDSNKTKWPASCPILRGLKNPAK